MKKLLETNYRKKYLIRLKNLKVVYGNDERKIIMKTVYAKIYSQHRGRIKFPIDMLRYDSCYPAKETDSHFLKKLTDEQQVFNNKKHWVVVVAKKVPEKAKAPHFTNKRWESFKCFVEETGESLEESQFLDAHESSWKVKLIGSLSMKDLR